MKMIESIYFGEICPFEKISQSIPGFSEYIKKTSDKTEQLQKTMSKEQIALFLEYNATLNDMYQICEKHSFIEGVKLEAKITTEIFQLKD